MGAFLIAATDWLALDTWTNILQVAIGLGVVIFVHELGHFLVAKACGVKCEKFYVGFDVPMPKIGPFQIPSKLIHFQWGETEYGIGIIPLGGYVKMLGQDDNPANAEKEAERTRVQKGGSEATAGTGSEDAAAHPHHQSVTDVDMEPQPLAENVDYEIDPRSYTAKNVPQRMAIISAGVIMNVIFAVIFATIAYKVGVPYTPCYIAGTSPGSPSWIENIPIDRQIVQIGKTGEPREHLRWQHDLMQRVQLTGAGNELNLGLRRPGQIDAPIEWVTIQPVKREIGSRTIALIGIRNGYSLELAPKEPVAVDFLPAGEAKPGFKPSDRVVAVAAGDARQAVANSVELDAFLSQHPDEPITFTVERTVGDSKDKDAKKEEVDIEVGTNPVRRLGLVMKMGPIVAVQNDSPAANAGLKAGDVILAVNGQSPVDPVVLPQMLQRLAGEEVTLDIYRGESKEASANQQITVTPRQPTQYHRQVLPGEPMAAEALGIAYQIENKVVAVLPGSPAAGKIKPGDMIESLTFVPGGENADEKKKTSQELAEKYGLQGKPIELGEKEDNWPATFLQMQLYPPSVAAKVIYRRGQDMHDVEITPTTFDEFHLEDRGLVFTPLTGTHEAQSWGEAFSLGLRETKESLLLVVTFLRKLATGQLSPTNLGGPGSIFYMATAEASQGTSRLLVFLTMLSANLAVINILPIPVLDGGHLMFLIYEGIFRRPVNEKWAIRLTLLGLSFVLGLMVFVIGLDIYHLSGIAG